MNFFRAFYITGATSVAVTILAFLNNVFLTRYLGPEGRGEYSIVANLILVLALVFGEGIRRSNIIVVGRHPGTAKKQAIKTLLVFSAMLILAGIIYLTVPVKYFDFLNISSSLVYLGLFTALFVILWRSLQAVLLGIQDYKSFNGAQLAYTFLLLLFNAAIVFVFKFGLYEIIMNFIIVASIVSAYEIFLLQKKKHTDSEVEAESKSSFIFRATFVSVTGFIFLKGDIFIVNYFLETSSTGIYSITKVIADIFQKLPLILGPIVIARSASNEVKDEVIRISRMSRILIFVNILAVGGTLLIGEWAITTVFSNDFQLSYALLVFLLPSLVVFSSGHVINAFLMGQGFPFFLLIVNLVFAVSSVSLNILLLPKLGINAAALICSVNYTLWAGSFIAYFSRRYNMPLRKMIIPEKEDFKIIKGYLFA